MLVGNWKDGFLAKPDCSLSFREDYDRLEQFAHPVQFTVQKLLFISVHLHVLRQSALIETSYGYLCGYLSILFVSVVQGSTYLINDVHLIFFLNRLIHRFLKIEILIRVNL